MTLIVSELQRRSLVSKFAAVLAAATLAGCDAEMTAPQGSYSVNLVSSPTITAGHNMALSCLQTQGVPITGNIDAFTLWIVPGASMDSEGNASYGFDLPNAGVTDFVARRIYIVQYYATERRAWAHEFLHVLTGSRDHPAFFSACGLHGIRRRR